MKPSSSTHFSQTPISAPIQQVSSSETFTSEISSPEISSSEISSSERRKNKTQGCLEHDVLFSKPPLHSHNHLNQSESAAHEHVHSEASLRKIVNRLSRLEGHIRGVKTMVQENRPCPDVLVQVAAVKGGLDRVARVILDEHLNECMTRAANEGNLEAEIDALKTALDRFIS